MWALNNWLDGPFHRLWILNRAAAGRVRGILREVILRRGARSRFRRRAAAWRGSAGVAHRISRRRIYHHAKLLRGRMALATHVLCRIRVAGRIARDDSTGREIDAKLAEYQITRDGHGVEACGIDAATYQNPVGAEQDRGRAILAQMGAAIIIPRYPLKPGRYSVTATLNDHAYQWSFAVAAASAEPDPYGEAPEKSGARPESNWRSAYHRSLRQKMNSRPRCAPVTRGCSRVTAAVVKSTNVTSRRRRLPSRRRRRSSQRGSVNLTVTAKPLFLRAGGVVRGTRDSG